MSYVPILLDLLHRAQAEFTKRNADLAATSRNLKSAAASSDEMTGAIVKREAAHREFSMFTGDQGRA